MSTDVNLITFQVADDGTLYIGDMDDTLTRGDCWVLFLSDSPSADDLVSLADENWDAKQILGNLFEKRNPGREWDPDSDLDEVLEWLEANSPNLSEATQRLRRWLDDTSLTDEDYDAADLNGVTAQGAALIFWRDGDLDPDDFGIVVVEGEHPGSSYYAAELRESIEYANEVADRLGAPVRFV
jgi:hypothetical protein